MTKEDNKNKPGVLTIFGGTGDLSMRYLLPSLLHMVQEGVFPENFRVVCVGRRPLDTESFFQMFLNSNKEALQVKPEFRQKFLSRLTYFRGDIGESGSYVELAKELRQVDENGGHACFDRLYYFATAPEFFEQITKNLKSSGLLVGCTKHNRTVRVLVEKPFGNDLKSAKKLNALLGKFFAEKQIYRIDHYLGKETVQNLLSLRFANDFLEPIWNKNFVDHIEISVLELLGVGNRVKFYDEVGALKDMVQNHILQMLALTLMDEPKSFNSEDIRAKKLLVLSALKKFNAKSILGNVVRGQYRAFGNSAGYVQELGKDSGTETFVAFKTFVENSRWKGVPIYIRTGKKLSRKATEISVHFKHKINKLFPEMRSGNVMSLGIHPDEHITMQINNKVPGFGMAVSPMKMSFGYAENFKGNLLPAYERLLLDFVQDDQRLFISSKEVEEAWKFVDSIAENWNEKNAILQSYMGMSEGPKGAEGLISKDGRDWWTR